MLNILIEAPYPKYEHDIFGESYVANAPKKNHKIVNEKFANTSQRVL